MPTDARGRLLDAADELFYSRGIGTTGVDAVVTQAGVALGSLYKNFGGKDQLVLAYLRARDERWLALWDESVAAVDDPVERVLAIFTALGRWSSGTDRGCAHIAALGQVEGAGREVVAAAKQHVLARLTELVAATGCTDAEERARDVMMIYEGVFGPRALGLDPAPLERARRLARGCLVS